MTLPRKHTRIQELTGDWLPDSLNDVASESYWRSRMILAATGLVLCLAIFSASLQASRGSSSAAVVAYVFALALVVIPLILRYTGSLMIAGNILAGALFISLSAVNIASGGTALGAELSLVLVPALAFLAPGRIGPWVWSTLVCLEIVTIPYLGSLGLPIWITVDPEIARQAIHRIPLLLVVFMLAGGLTTYRIARNGLRIREEQQSLLDRLYSEKKRLQESLLERQEVLASVGTLAASVAHQINNQIGVVLLTAQFGRMIAKDSDQQSEVETAFEVIEKEAIRCGKIVHSLLRISSGEPSEKWEEELHTVVFNAFHAATPYAKERKARLELALDEVAARLVMSPIELEQAIVNLIRNGLEARETDALVIVRTVVRSNQVRIEVCDNGLGLSKDDCGRVFEPFYTTRGSEGGTGLGLSLVKRIVEDHSGSVSAYPRQDGQGTVFAIELPIGPLPLEINIS